jgi:hypothetical protein
MANYDVTALSLDQSGSSSRFLLAVSVFDSNGSGVPNLDESNFTVHTLTSATPFSIAEVQSAGLPGFYRLFLRAEMGTYGGEWALALIVTGRHHVVGRVPGTLDSGHALVKVRA